MAQIRMEPILKLVSVWNNFVLISIAFGWFSEVSIIEMMTIIATRIRKTIPILSINGSVGNNHLNKNPNGIVTIAAQTAELEVARFQNKPSIKMATIPGLTNPVNS